jgi:hypothetical protein
MPTYQPMSQEKIILTLQKVSLMSIEQLYQFGTAIKMNIQTMNTLGGYPQQQMDEHREWISTLAHVVLYSKYEMPIDYAQLEKQLCINSLLRKLEMTDDAYHQPILAQIETI